jgi:iron(III) transport system permease protein
MALPAYVLAFVAVATLDYAGPVQVLLREAFGPGLRLPPIRSTGGVIAGAGARAVSRTSTCSPAARSRPRGAARSRWRSRSGSTLPAAFVRVALPLARPWIAAGVALVAMETLADFGTVSVFNYDTFTTAIYRAWFGLYSIEAALQLAGVLVLLVAVALAFEQRARGARHTALAGPPARHRPPTGARAAARDRRRGLVLLVALVLPLGTLVAWAADHVAPRPRPGAISKYAARSARSG